MFRKLRPGTYGNVTLKRKGGFSINEFMPQKQARTESNVSIDCRSVDIKTDKDDFRIKRLIITDKQGGKVILKYEMNNWYIKAG